MEKRKQCVNSYLEGKGYNVNDSALFIIGICDDWYSNRCIKEFHKRSNLNGVEMVLNRTNFAKRCCGDDANLCEVISVAPEKEENSADFINEFLDRNRFDVMFREQLEKTSAMGTVGAYIYLKNADIMLDAKGNRFARGGEVRINYVEPDCIIPLTVDNDMVIECAFASTNLVKGKEKTTLVIFTQDEQSNYQCETVYFDANGNRLENESTFIQLGNIKPFSIMKTAEVNNLDNMQGYGLPKVYNSIIYFKAADLCYNILFGDLDKGQKIVFINELLAMLQKDENGNAYLTPQQKELFILLGEKLPDQDSIVKEYNPEIRIESITKAFELILSLLSMQFGFGTRRYTFDQGQIQTATQYIGERQDSMQELNKQRKQAVDYINDLVHAAMWFENQFNGSTYNVEEVLKVEFDDSFVEDRVAKLEQMRTDALSFPEVVILKVWYLMEKYNLPEEEAKKYIDGGFIDNDESSEE